MTIQEAYNKITSSDSLKKAAIEAAKAGKTDEFFKENGIDLTMDEIKNYVINTKNGLLSREELNMAAGGCDSNVCAPVFSLFTIGFGCLASDLIEGHTICWD